MSFLMMSRDMRAMEPKQLVFWGAMSAGVMAGYALAYPANVWMVAQKLKHGLMTVRDMIPLSASGDATRSNDAKMGDPHSAHKPEGHEEASKAAGVHHGAGHKMESQATWPQLLAIGVVRRLALKTTIGFDTGRYEANFTEDDLRIRIVLHH